MCHLRSSLFEQPWGDCSDCYRTFEVIPWLDMNGEGKVKNGKGLWRNFLLIISLVEGFCDFLAILRLKSVLFLKL